MLLCVREVMDAGGRLPVRIGVNRGAVFVGEIGPHYRRTFTVMGDAVNLAARLMAKAGAGPDRGRPPTCSSRSRTSFATEELEPFLVKGKAKPVRAFLLGDAVGEQERRAPSTSFRSSGRRAELARARAGGRTEAAAGPGRTGRDRRRARVGQVPTGAGGAGPPARAAAAAAVHLPGTTTPPPRTTSSAGCSASCSACPSEGSDAATRRAVPLTVAERAPAVLPWAPLVARADRPPGAGHRRDPGPGRGVPASAAGPGRPGSAGRGAARLRGLLCIDDAHFMDEASADLFGAPGRGGRRLTLLADCVARRSVDTGFVAPEASVSRHRARPAGPAGDALTWPGWWRPTACSPHASSMPSSTGRREPALPPGAAGRRTRRWRRRRPARHRRRCGGRPHRQPVDRRPLPAPPAGGARAGRSRSIWPETSSRSCPTRSDPVWRRLDEFLVRDGSGTLGLPQRPAARQRLRRAVVPAAAPPPPVPATRIRKSTSDAGDTQPEILSFHYLHAQRWDEAWEFSLDGGRAGQGRLRQFRGRGVLRTGPPRRSTRRRRCTAEELARSTRSWGTPEAGRGATCPRRRPTGRRGVWSAATRWPRRAWS